MTANIARRLALVALLALLALAGGAGVAAYPARDTAPRASAPPAQPVATGDWPTYGHDNARTNYNPDETTIAAGNVAQLVQRWQVNIGSNGTATSAAPSVSDGRVFVASSAASPANNLL